MIRGVVALSRGFVVRVPFAVGFAGVLVQIEAGAECVTISGDRDSPNVVIVSGVAERDNQRSEQLVIQRVLAFRTI